VGKALRGKRIVSASGGPGRGPRGVLDGVIGRLLRAPLTWLGLAVVAVGAVFGLYWFQPWKLVTDREVSETLSSPAPVRTAPAVAPSVGRSSPTSTTPRGRRGSSAPPTARTGWSWSVSTPPTGRTCGSG
jgi:hypothetical protein